MAKEQKARSVREVIESLVSWTPNQFTPRPTAEVPDLFETLLCHHPNTRLRRSWFRVRVAMGCGNKTEVMIAKYDLRANG